MTRTINLTAEEIAKLDTVPRFNNPRFPTFAAIQEATIALRKRTGIRYGTQVKQGRYDIVTVAYAINGKGKPTGGGAVDIIVAGLTGDELVNAINEVAP